MKKRFTQWAGISSPEVLNWMIKAMNGKPGDKPFPEAVWPITDDLTCGTIDGYPEPEQFFAVTFDPGTQALLCALLNGLPTARSDDGPVPAIATLDSLCMTFRHDFGWLDEEQKNETRQDLAGIFEHHVEPLAREKSRADRLEGQLNDLLRLVAHQGLEILHLRDELRKSPAGGPK